MDKLTLVAVLLELRKQGQNNSRIVNIRLHLTYLYLDIMCQTVLRLYYTMYVFKIDKLIFTILF